ncbi:MAG: arylamine N-acetyltransferase [Acidimicrobiia bacterium]
MGTDAQARRSLDGIVTCSADDRDAYLARLGLEGEPPSADALHRLHRAHVERVPWETLWIHLGQRWTLEIDAAVQRIARGRRGGYCYHLNGAFSALLGSLGYDVRLHVGGVHGPAGPSVDTLTNHLALTVQDLPSDANPGGSWYVDVGLGEALYEPVPLAPGRSYQAPWRLELEVASGDVGDWHLAHDPEGSFAGMSWLSAPTTIDAFEERHQWLSTSPESGFVRLLIVQRRDAIGVDALYELTLRRIGSDTPDRTIESKHELHDALGDVFALDTTPIEAGTFESLWARLQSSQAAYPRS